MQELTKLRQFERLEDWLSFGDWILKRPNDPPGNEESRRSDESKEHPDWRSCRREVGDFIGVCVSKDVQAPLAARDAVAVLLRQLCTQFDFRLDQDHPVLLNRHSQITEAINNTRSRALQSLFEFGYWLRRHGLAEMPREIREILNSRLTESSDIPLTLPEHAILGLHFGQIWELDNEWAVANKVRLFPRERLDVWREAFKAFISFSQPFLPFFKVLSDDFAYALDNLDALHDAQGMGLEATDALGQHLFTYYLWQVYPLQGPDSLLGRFYECTDARREYWAHLFDHVGVTLRNTNLKLDEKLHKRIVEFFDWRLQKREPKELKEFAFWLEAHCLDADWRLDAFLKILQVVESTGMGLSMALDSLNEMLEVHPAKVIECLAKITDSFAAEGSFYFPIEKTKSMLLAGLNSTIEGTRANAERARDNLLKAGRFEFLNLK